MVTFKRETCSNIKTIKPFAEVLLCVWWDMKVVHFELLVQKRAIAAGVYCQQLNLGNEGLRLALVNRKYIITEHDNARAHCKGKESRQIKIVRPVVPSTPQYSPDLSLKIFLFVSINII